MDTAICLHNANVLTGFSVMQNCAVYIKNDKIADVYSEQRFQQKKIFAQGKNNQCQRSLHRSRLY